jgi:hypothetical protein
MRTINIFPEPQVAVNVQILVKPRNYASNLGLTSVDKSPKMQLFASYFWGLPIGIGKC